MAEIILASILIQTQAPAPAWSKELQEHRIREARQRRIQTRRERHGYVTQNAQRRASTRRNRIENGQRVVVPRMMYTGMPQSAWNGPTITHYYMSPRVNDWIRFFRREYDLHYMASRY